MDIVSIFEPEQLGRNETHQAGLDTEIGTALGTIFDEINETIQSTLTSISIYSLLLLKNKLAEKELEAILNIEIGNTNSETEEP